VQREGVAAADRERIRNLIWQALNTPAPAQQPTPSPAATGYVLPTTVPDPPGDAGHMEPEYIAERLNADLLPLAKSCYSDAAKRDPQLSGKIILHFVIVGDAHIGGVVESADVLDESSIRDPEFVDSLGSPC
jgi:hypothetical protein